MTKATSKIFAFLFFGLLLSICLPVSVAFSTDEIVRLNQDPWEFMQENATAEGYSQFVSDYGQKEGWKNTNIVQCGTEICNLATSKCLSKGNLSAGRTIINTILNRGKAATTVRIEYICVPKDEVATMTSQGWSEIEGGSGSISTVTAKEGGNTSSKSYELDKTCYTAQEPTGETVQYCAKTVGNEIIIRSGNDKERGCDVIPVRVYNDSKCRFCSLIGVIFKTADSVAAISRNALASGFAIVIAVGMAIWMAMKTFVFVSSMTSQDAAKYITEMLKQSYKFIIAFFLLLYYDDVFTFIINPLLNAGLEFGLSFASGTSVEKRFEIGNLSVASLQGLGENLPLDYARNLDNNYYNIFTYSSLENLAYNINLNYSLLQAIGSGLNCLGWRYILLIFGENGWEIGLGFGCVIYGLFFSLFGFLSCLAFIFYILDAVVQLGVVGALLPFLIASWPFKITSKYTSTGFKILLNSIFTFMMIGLVVKISISLISKAVELNTEIETSQQTISGGGLYELVQAIDNIDTEKLRIMVNVLSVGFLVFLFANILGFLLLARVSELVNRFSSGGMKASAPSLATMGASAIKGVAKKATAPTREAVGNWAEDKAIKGTRMVGNIITMRPVRRWAYNKIDDAISRASDSGRKAGAVARNEASAQNPANRAVVGKGNKTGKPLNTEQNKKATIGRKDNVLNSREPGKTLPQNEQNNNKPQDRTTPDTNQEQQARGSLPQDEQNNKPQDRTTPDTNQEQQTRGDSPQQPLDQGTSPQKDKTNKPSGPRIDRKKLDEMD